MGERRLIKRSVTLDGHRTSVALESPFWDTLDRLAAARGAPLAALIAEVDRTRARTPLASGLRCLALEAALGGEV